MNEELAELISSYRQKGLTDELIINNLRNTWAEEDILNELKNTKQDTIRSATESTITTKKRLDEPFRIKHLFIMSASILLLLIVGLVVSHQIQNKNNYNNAVATAEKRYKDFLSTGISSIERPKKQCEVEYQGFNSGERCEISFRVYYESSTNLERLRNIALQMGFDGDYNYFRNPENYKEYVAVSDSDENVKAIHYSYTYKHL
jgi:hypothetical protein